MATVRSVPETSTGTSLADVLERLLDKGIVIAGDIRVKLVEVELLTIQIRLVVCSVDRAREIGIAWWEGGAPLPTPPAKAPEQEATA